MSESSVSRPRSAAAFDRACQVIPGGVNSPARAFGAACASGVWTNHWLYWVAPMAAGAAAARIYHSLLSSK